MISEHIKALPVVIAMVLFPITACSQSVPVPDGDVVETVMKTLSVADALARLEPLLGTFTVSGTQAGADGGEIWNSYMKMVLTPEI